MSSNDGLHIAWGLPYWSGAYRVIAFFALVLYFPLLHAEDVDIARLKPIAGSHLAYTVESAPARWENTNRSANPDPNQILRRTSNIIFGAAATAVIYGTKNWWQDGFNDEFQTDSEGWFGQNTYSGGADKLGHFYTNYAGARLFARAFEWAGNSPDSSLTLAAWTTLGIFTAVEIIDGFSKRWSFSKEDAIMNVLGVGTALLLEKNKELDRLLDLRLLYRPSDEEGGFSPFSDYSGQIYLVAFKATGIPSLREHPVLRYFEIAVGYGAKGYSTAQANGGDSRSRNLYVGLSVNLSEVLRGTVYKHSGEKGRFQWAANTFLEFVQVPGTAALVSYQLPTD